MAALGGCGDGVWSRGWKLAGGGGAVGEVEVQLGRADDPGSSRGGGGVDPGLGGEAAGVAGGGGLEGFPVQLPCARGGCVAHGGNAAGDAGRCAQGGDARDFPVRSFSSAAGLHGFVAPPDERGAVRAGVGVAGFPRSSDGIGDGAQGPPDGGLRAEGDGGRWDAVPVAHRGTAGPSDGRVDRAGDLQPSL